MSCLTGISVGRNLMLIIEELRIEGLRIFIDFNSSIPQFLNFLKHEIAGGIILEKKNYGPRFCKEP